MQTHLNHLTSACKDLDMITNALKCEGMYACPHQRRRPITLPDLQLNGTPLPLVHEVKLLGVYLNSLLTWDTHVKHLVKKANRCIFILIRARQFGFCTKTMQTLYQWYIRTGLEYAAPVWHSSLTQGDTLKLERIQKRCFRIILGPRYVTYENALRCLNTCTLAERREKLALRFGRSLLRSPTYRHWLPPTMGAVHGRATRHRGRLQVPLCRTERYRKSTIPYLTRKLNEL